jgi:hypothetical protein
VYLCDLVAVAAGWADGRAAFLDGRLELVDDSKAVGTLLLATLASFNVRMGRIDDAATAAFRPARFVRLGWLGYCILAIGLAAPLFLPFILSRADFIVAGFDAALIFSLGLLLLLARASWPTGPDGTPHGDRRVWSEQVSTPALVRAKWVSAGRLVPGILLMPLVVLFDLGGRSADNTLALVTSVAFMLSVSFAAVSLGVALWAWCRGSVWGVIVAITVWALMNTVGIAVGSLGVHGPSRSLSDSFVPFSGVTTLAFLLNVANDPDLGRVSSAVVATAAYVAAAVLLYVAAFYSPRSSIEDLNRNRAEVI